MTKLDDTIQLIDGTRHLDPSNTGLCIELMKDFLRREALWANRLGVSDEIPFSNLASVISEIDHSEPYLDSIKRYTYSVAESRCCSAMLNWYSAMNASAPTITEQDLPDPYQPLLQFFRLGGTFGREHRVFIEVNGSTMIQANLIQQGDLSKPYISIEE